MKKISVLLLTSILALTAYSQEVLTANRASKLIKDAELIRLKDDEVNYVRLNEESSWTEQNWRQKLIENFGMDPSISFQELNRSQDQLGMTHIRNRMLINNIPLEFEQLVLHLRQNKLESFNGSIFQNINIANTASNEMSAGLAEALKYVNADVYKWEVQAEEDQLKMEQADPSATYYPKGELVVIRNANQFRLAYSFDIYAHMPLSRQQIYVDAQTNKVIDVEEKIHTGNIPGIAHTVYSGIQNIITDSLNGVYRLRDTTRGRGVRTFDMNNSTQHNQAVDFTDTDNIWNNVNAQKNQYAGDAHWGAERMYDYLDSVHNRNSIDNQGFPLLSYVHYGTNYNNAFWDGQRMTYGDGDARTNPLTTLDITGHEIAHGLTNFTAALRYRSESGALNESFSDIFGVALEFFARPTRANWFMGEDIGSAFRSISNPNNFGDPDTYDGSFWIDQNCTPTRNNDWCGVHTNSGVQNYWYYLLTQGGNGVNDKGFAFNVNPLGMDTASKIAFRNLTVYLTQNSNHDDARFYAIQSAIDLYGACSPAVESVTNAWYAVGVGRAYTPGVDAEFYAVMDTIYCSLPATVEFENNPNNVQSYRWDFGDGTTSTQASPIHTYNAVGSYNVKLIVDGGVCGTDSVEKSSYIVVDTNQVCPYISVPNGMLNINACSGSLFDNGGLNGEYLINAFDTIIIRSSQGDYINVNIDSIAIEAGYNGYCNHDFIEVFDGPSTDYKSLGRFCSSSGNVSLSSSSNAITIFFFSDTKKADAGFKLSWNCATSTAVPSTMITTDVDTSCNGKVKFYDLTSGPVNSRSWNFGDGFTSTERNPIHEYVTNGTYTATLSNANLSGSGVNVATKTVVVNRPTSPSVLGDSSCVNGNYKLSATGGGRLEWFDSKKDGNLMFLGDTLRIANVNSDTNFFVQSYYQNPRVIGTPIAIAGSTFHTDTTAELYITVNEKTLLESFILYSNKQGDRRIDIKNMQGEIIESKLVYAAGVPSQVTVNFELSPGSYSMSIGNREPSLMINSTGAAYPYNFGNFMSVTGSSMGANAYPFFYYMIARPLPCISERSEVKGLIDTNCVITSIPDQIMQQSISIFPNPVKDRLHVEFEDIDNYESIAIYNVNGQLIQSNPISSNVELIDMREMTNGFYFLEISTDSGIRRFKIIKR